MPNRPIRQFPVRSCRVHSAVGFTLLEVLVAILILSFGVLGAAGMQIAALQSNKEARYQANAARLGRQLADLIRANNVVASSVAVPTSTAGNPFLLDFVTSTVPLPSSPVYSPACMASSSSPPACAGPPYIESAQWAAQSWINQLADPTDGLPAPRVRVCFDNTPINAAGQMQWDCTGQTTNSPPTPMYVKIAWARSALSAGSRSASTPAIETGEVAPMLVLPVVP